MILVSHVILRCIALAVTGTNDSHVAHSGVSQLPPGPRVGLFFCGDQPLHHRSQLSKLSYGGHPTVSHRAHRLASDQTCVDLDQTDLSESKST